MAWCFVQRSSMLESTLEPGPRLLLRASTISVCIFPAFAKPGVYTEVDAFALFSLQLDVTLITHEHINDRRC